jgi:DNA-directed RNA polymerase subunit RPC12/RpoP
MKCPNCNSEDIIKGKFGGASNVFFIPDGKLSLIKDVFPAEVYVCKDCGMVVNILVKKLK